MGKRIMVAVIFIPLLVVLIYGVSPAYPVVLPILIAALSMIAVHEVLWSTGFLKHTRLSGYSIVLAGLVPFWVYYSGELLPALCGMFVYVVLLFAEAIGSHKRITLEKMGGAFFLSVVIPFFLSSSVVASGYEMCAKAFQLGWAGVVYKTVGFLTPSEVSPRFAVLGGEGESFVGLRNLEQISDHPLERDLEVLR